MTEPTMHDLVRKYCDTRALVNNPVSRAPEFKLRELRQQEPKIFKPMKLSELAIVKINTTHYKKYDRSNPVGTD